MTAITTRAGKGSPLTNAEVDANFTGLNTDKEAIANKGVANGYAGLDATGKVPAAQLPSYVDDVLEYASLSGFPATGEAGKIYVACDTNKTYRWSGSAYIVITASPGSSDEIVEGTTNLYFTGTRAAAAAPVQSVAGKTGSVSLVKSDVGLGNAENKSSATIRGEITSLNVTTALGFTPYAATNPNGYISVSGVTWTNLSGKPTTLSGYGITDAADSSHTHSYLPLAGGTLTGLLIGATSSLAMSQEGGAARGSYVCRASGTGDANLAGMTFHNDVYAIKLGVRADGFFGLGGWSRAAWSWYSDPNGNMVAAGNVTAYSDPRLKENFKRVENPLELLSKLDGGTFNWKHGFPHVACKAGNLDYGILADQVEAVMPEIVTESIEIDGERYKTVAYEKLVPVLIEAIKELSSQIAVLGAK